MPTYEYACKSCEQHMEVAQSFSDEPLTECPACGGDLRKVYGNIGVSFKGKGFYKNDSRPNGGGHDHGSHDHGHDHGSPSKSSDPTDRPIVGNRKAPKPEALAKAMTSIPEMARKAADEALKGK